MFQNFSQDFASYKDTSFINLNNGTLGLCPSVVIDQQKAELEIFEKNTSSGYGDAWARLWRIQQGLGDFLNANPRDLFLRPNVTLALNEIIMGLNLPANSEILTNTFEYGAVVNILKHKCQRDDLSLRSEDFSALYDCSTDEAVVEVILKAVSAKTRMLLISHVFTGNGLIVPLAKLARELRKRNILLVVDGAHAPGLLKLDFKQEIHEVDFYAGNLHKWFMGPKGTAFGWVHPDHQSTLNPQYGSWTMSENVPANMASFAPPGEFASRMLWSHSQSFTAYYGLEAALSYWTHHKADVIRQQIQVRMKYLKDSLADAGIFALVNNYNSAFLCYNVGEFPHAQFQGIFLKDTPLQVGLPRLPGAQILRLTPHIHNTQEELSKAVQILKDHRTGLSKV
ncbi:aminotransferase class V-fold PLP-dependent enzyme [Bdellovibrio bacteriovorus]|uniref:aminotransferase class V-fold PLP-dependent enzyme n=1 Tax=Bdellovibrio bacteriovorus TaxID=959 RepID=UPI0021D11FD7|nr:aminotransferase class V-fold PLP-dependent enzyme [Bdellovibrio bacteriovorus]UXR63511.1 aminotransferase class V-fold PLP-dependent enzyme [Bdellovibrio bacteriovorus]